MLKDWWLARLIYCIEPWQKKYFKNKSNGSDKWSEWVCEVLREAFTVHGTKAYVIVLTEYCTYEQKALDSHIACRLDGNVVPSRLLHKFKGFLQRAAMLVLQALYYSNSIHLSHAGIMSKRLHVARCSLHCQIGKCV